MENTFSLRFAQQALKNGNDLDIGFNAFKTFKLEVNELLLNGITKLNGFGSVIRFLYELFINNV